MSIYDPARRTALRSVLAAGSALWISLSWGAGAPPGAAQKPAPATGAKVAKAQVNYQEQPRNKQKCADCQHFIAPGTCKLVDGTVTANGWCTLFAQKAG